MNDRLLRGRSTPAIRAINLTSAAKAAIQIARYRHGWKPCPPESCLPLALFVFRILADHPHHALAVNDLALVANFLYRCSYFHKAVLGRSWLVVCQPPVQKLPSRASITCSDTQFVRDLGRRARAQLQLCRPAECE